MLYIKCHVSRDCPVEPEKEEANSSEICWKMLRNLIEKLAGKFPVRLTNSTLSHSMVKITCLDDAFSEVFRLEASPVEGQSLQQKERNSKGEKRKAKK